MGSLTSRPKAPAVRPTVVYTTPAPAPSATPPPASSGDNPSPDPTPEEQQEAVRSAGLLDRRRGVLSTVVTGFRGILSQGNEAPRKTLLGE